MKVFITFIVSLICTLPIHAQVRVKAISQKFQLLPSHLIIADTLDYSIITIQYSHTYPVDNFSDGFNLVNDVLELQIGKKFNKFFSYNLYLMDRNITYNERNKVEFRLDYTDYEIFTDNQKKIITVQHRIPFSRLVQGTTQVAEYEEHIPAIKWNISNQTDSIAGYPCMRATGQMGGRDWIVWFTPELPFSFGPWKLGGLPGVILRANDSDHEFLFDVQQIVTTPEPIVRYDWHPVKMSKSKWQKTEAKMYNNPKDYFFPSYDIDILNHVTHQPLEDEWKVRYNPIER